MKNCKLLLFAVLFQITIPISVRCDDENPFLDLASSFLQNMNDSEGGNDSLGMLGNIVSAFVQNNANSEGSNPANILSGLGSLLGGQGGKIDPSVLGAAISMFTQNMASSPEKSKRSSESSNDINLEGILSVASNFLTNKNTAGVLPLIVNAISTFSEEKVQKTAETHKDHSSFMPPFLEKVHLYWDLFINSDLGKTVWEKSGLKRAMKPFTAPDGSISFEVMFKNFENRSFRRHWIKVVAEYVTSTVVQASKPENMKRYLPSIEYIANSYIDSQGFPKSTRFNAKKPEESITALVNHVLKNQMNMDTDASSYVKSAVDYAKQIFKMAESTSQSLTSRADYSALTDKVTDTLNLEVIEPVLRVYRAYRHSVNAPHCQEHLMCLVNRHHDSDKEGLPGFKKGITKLSSLIASAALSYQNGKGFFDLYNAIQSDVNCESKYPADCAAFHEEEQRVTTEIYHSEL